MHGKGWSRVLPAFLGLEYFGREDEKRGVFCAVLIQTNCWRCFRFRNPSSWVSFLFELVLLRRFVFTVTFFAVPTPSPPCSSSREGDDQSCKRNKKPFLSLQTPVSNCYPISHRIEHLGGPSPRRFLPVYFLGHVLDIRIVAQGRAGSSKPSSSPGAAAGIA